MSNITSESSDLLLGALGEQLDARGERCERRDYGPGLVVYFASRYDESLRGALEFLGVSDVSLET